MRLILSIVLVLLSSAVAWTATLSEASFSICSLLGGSNDLVRAARIQSDGAIVLAANVSSGPVAQQASGNAAGRGLVIRLAPGGSRLSAAYRVGMEARDLAIDSQDNIYVALGREGVAKLDRQVQRLLWKKDTGGLAARLDAAADGTCAVLNYDTDNDTTPGPGTVLVLAADGSKLGTFKGRHNTIDVAIDGTSQTVITIGWRQANAFDGRRKEPVQIAHLTGRSYSGVEKYHLYDWSTDTNSPAFINRPANNMADTRGYRVALGADGRLYAAFECAGGNHIFRFEPRLIQGAWVDAKAKKPKADAYHSFHNSRAEHKVFVARFDPATGEYLSGQEFCGRLSNGRANAVRVKSGAIAAGPDGTLYLAGTAAYGLPVSFLPPGTGDYTGGGFVLGIKPGLNERLFCLRLQAGAEVHAVDARRIGNRTIVVCGGTTSTKSEPFWTKNALQTQAPPGSGFFAVFTIE